MKIVNLIFLNICFIFVITYASKISSGNKLPFSSIKIINDEFLFTLDKSRSKWHKLSSINNIGEDVFIKRAKDYFGEKSCSYEIECYKYNLILNFPHIFKLVSGIALPKVISVEYLPDGQTKHTEIKLVSTEENFKINNKHKEDNINGNNISLINIFIYNLFII